LEKNGKSQAYYSRLELNSSAITGEEKKILTCMEIYWYNSGIIFQIRIKFLKSLWEYRGFLKY